MSMTIYCPGFWVHTHGCGKAAHIMQDRRQSNREGDQPGKKGFPPKAHVQWLLPNRPYLLITYSTVMSVLCINPLMKLALSRGWDLRRTLRQIVLLGKRFIKELLMLRTDRQHYGRSLRSQAPSHR